MAIYFFYGDEEFNIEQEINKFDKLLTKLPSTFAELRLLCGNKQEIVDLEKIINSVQLLSKGRYNIEFDLSLVRGQGYYTGTVFEIKSEEYHCSIGGGGRYDGLIGKFIGQSVPAVGFSIGFERIFSILKEKNILIPASPSTLILPLASP